MIDGRELQAEPDRGPVRVVVKLSERAVREGDRQAFHAMSSRAMDELRRIVPDAEFRPYFDEPGLRAATQPPFNRCVAVEAPNRQAAADLARRLQAHDLVEEAYVGGGPCPRQ